MSTAQLPSSTFVYSPTPSLTKPKSVHFSTCPFKSSSSIRSGSFAIKCSDNNNNNNTGNLNNSNAWKDLLSAVSQLITRDAERVVQHETEIRNLEEQVNRYKTKADEQETEIKNMKQELNHYKTRAGKNFGEQKTQVKNMKQEVSHDKTRVAENEDCQKRVEDALRLLSELELSLKDISLKEIMEHFLRNCDEVDCSS